MNHTTSISINSPLVRKLRTVIKKKYGFSWSEIASSDHHADVTEMRRMLVKYMYTEMTLNQENIAFILKIKQCAVSKIIKKHDDLVQVEPKYKENYTHFVEFCNMN